MMIVVGLGMDQPKAEKPKGKTPVLKACERGANELKETTDGRGEIQRHP